MEPAFNMSTIDRFQAVNLCVGSLTEKVLVSMSQPRVFLTSSRRPSASNFLRHRRSALDIGSVGSNGRPNVWMARGTAAEALGLLVGECKEMVTVSSM